MLKILYICTHNRCRSILSEAITNHSASSSLVAKSAGSQPAGEVHPLSLRYLGESGYTIDGLASESWDCHENFRPDVVITVCDSAAGESCPLWFGNSIKLHWGLTDPSKIDGTEEVIAEAFEACIKEIETRVTSLSAIAEQSLPVDELREALFAMVTKDL